VLKGNVLKVTGLLQTSYILTVRKNCRKICFVCNIKNAFIVIQFSVFLHIETFPDCGSSIRNILLQFCVLFNVSFFSWVSPGLVGPHGRNFGIILARFLQVRCPCWHPTN